MKRFLVLCFFLLGFGCAKNDKPTDPVTPPPPPPAAEITKDKVVVVHFAFNSKKLSAEQEKILKDAVAEHKAGTKMIVVGHTDSQGSKKYNQKLSDKRAKMVSDFLTKLGAENTWSGKGETALLNADKTKGEHKANRRAEVTFTIIVK